MSLMRATIHGCGNNTGSRVRSITNGCLESNAAAPLYGLVKTANESGGRRRHHSHSSDWIPPIFGGKSLVTKRCFTATPPAPRQPTDQGHRSAATRQALADVLP